MKRCALAALGLLTACSSGNVATVPVDGGRAVTDALPESGDASRDPGDATVGGGDASDAQVPSDDGASSACANEAVPPSTLACTGLYADIVAKTLAPGVRFYAPAVPLWSDAAQKGRWIQLPAGTQIDATDPNEWTFPVGTKVWKEFSKNGKRVETRLFQKVDSGPPSIWAHATYAWNADESAATSSNGGDITLDGDGGAYHIPTFAECEQCHNGRSDHVLGFEQVSLGQQGAQGLTLAELVAEGLIGPAPAQTQLTLGDDGTGAAAPALAWLHVNCGVTCHNGNSSATAYGVGMRLRLDPALLDGRSPTASEFDPLKTTLGVAATSPAWVQPVHWTRIVPGDSSHSLLAQLISNRGTSNPVRGQMPPIATAIVDTADVAKVTQWIDALPAAAPDAGPDAAIRDAGSE